MRVTSLPVVPAPASCARSPGPVSGPGAASGPCFAGVSSPWPPPFPPPPPPRIAPPCSAASPVLWGCPTSHPRASATCVRRLLAAVWAVRLPDGNGISRFPCKMCLCMLGVSDRAGSACLSRWRGSRCGFPHPSTASAPESELISRLNTRPALPPVNASPPSSRTPTHDSGPVWVATPSPYDSFIRYTAPV